MEKCFDQQQDRFYEGLYQETLIKLNDALAKIEELEAKLAALRKDGFNVVDKKS